MMVIEPSSVIGLVNKFGRFTFSLFLYAGNDLSARNVGGIVSVVCIIMVCFTINHKAIDHYLYKLHHEENSINLIYHNVQGFALNAARP